MKRTSHWLRRTAENRRGNHVAHDSLGVPKPYDAGKDLKRVLTPGGDAPQFAENPLA